MTNSNALVFGAGIPTAPDVKLLEQEIGIPDEGAEVTHEALEAVLALRRDTSRYRTVVHVWRKKMERENNVLLRAVSGHGYERCRPAERVTVASTTYKGGLRRIGRAAGIADTTDRDALSADQLRACDHISKSGAALRLAAATEAKRLKMKGTS